ncbi:MAG: hypothetical protein RDV41_03320, partial [Planctomycetota bacterium]|nr:hypothetical protein [Planctomycetota bacterium]
MHPRNSFILYFAWLVATSGTVAVLAGARLGQGWAGPENLHLALVLVQLFFVLFLWPFFVRAAALSASVTSAQTPARTGTAKPPKILPSMEPGEIHIQKEVAAKFSPAMAQTHRMVPIRFENNVLTVAMADPGEAGAIDDLRSLLECDIQGVVCDKDALNKALETYYSGQEDTIDKLIAEIGKSSVDSMDFSSATEKGKPPVDSMDFSSAFEK